MAGTRSLVVCADRKRRTIRIGKASMMTAATGKTHLERINTPALTNVATFTNTLIDDEQAMWLAKIRRWSQCRDQVQRVNVTGAGWPGMEPKVRLKQAGVYWSQAVDFHTWQRDDP